MADSRISLFCVVDGALQSNAFSVKAKPADTVDDLKKLIKAEKQNDFQDVDADNLTLFRVSIPINVEDNNDLPVLLGNVPDGKKLGPATRLSKVFPEDLPDETIHVIVLRPPPGHAPIPARISTPIFGYLANQSGSAAPLFATPTPLRSIPYDSVEKELAFIIEEANQIHVWHAVKAMDVETTQKEMLGPFYKKALPYGTTARDMNLAMLGMVLDKEPTSSDDKTLRKIVKSDIGKTTGFSVVALVGRLGSGKTATVIELAKSHFVVYWVCSNPRSIGQPDFQDRNFSTLAKDVERMCNLLPTPRSRDQWIVNDKLLKQLAGDRVELEFLARLLFLQLLLNKTAQLTPEQFFREQANGGAVTIGILVKKLREFGPMTIRDMLDQTQDKLATHLNGQGQGLVVAIDEAQIAGSCILSGEFISPTATHNNVEVFDDKGKLKEKYRRGFLAPLCASLSDVRATLVVLGTSLSLQDADHVYSAVSKHINFHRIMQFPLFDDQDVEDVLLSLVDTSGCTLLDVKRRKLAGRARFSVSVVRELFDVPQTSSLTKQVKLDKAFDSAIKLAKTVLRYKVRNLLENDRTGDVVHVLGRMALAFELQGGKIWFTSNSRADFMDKALCSLRMHSDGVHWLMDEPLVVEVVEEELIRSNVDPTFSEHLRQLNGIIENLGAKSTAKGSALEPLVRQILRRFSDFQLTDLPFLKGIKLPTWCKGRKLQIDEINTADGFGYKHGKTEADLEFLIDRPSNKLLVEQSGTRREGAWFFSENCYAGSLVIKFYSNAIPQADHQENETSSDIRSSFLQADGTKVNSSLKRIRDDFVASGVPDKIKGILRIYVEIPKVQGMQPTTHVRIDPATGIEDVIVYINLSNMDDFFYEGITENKRDFPNLKRLIKYVLAK